MGLPSDQMSYSITANWGALVKTKWADRVSCGVEYLDPEFAGTKIRVDKKIVPSKPKEACGKCASCPVTIHRSKSVSSQESQSRATASLRVLS